MAIDAEFYLTNKKKIIIYCSIIILKLKYHNNVKKNILFKF